jgi:pimeloyl-ACP methyl ester carboxylesterase
LGSVVARIVIVDRQLDLNEGKERVMTDERIHRAVSVDGTEIVGSVQGDGPPLVFVHGMMDDGTLQWKPAVPYLADRFECHVMSVRNRGNSGHSQDVSPPRLVEDVAAYASSIGEPVGLVGLSAGGAFVLGAASRLQNITGIVAYEPAVIPALTEEVRDRLVSTVMREAEQVQQGRLAEGMRIWAELVCNDEENAALDEADAFETLGANAPADLAILQQSREYQGPSALDPSALAEIKAPVLLLKGGRTAEASAPWFSAGVRYVDEHVPQTTVHEYPDLGHLAPMVAPGRVAEKIAEFFDSVGQAA